MIRPLEGILAVTLAGFSNGSFAVPFKRISAWSWDQIWLIYAATACLFFPLCLVFLLAPGVFNILLGNPLITGEVALLGALWGFGVLCFGLSLKQIGISATNALVNGVAVLVGSIGPAFFATARVGRTQMFLFIAGLTLTILGIVANSVASIQRENAHKGQQRTGAATTPASGIALALLSGVLGSILNIAFVCAEPLAQASKVAGMGTFTRSLTAWLPILLGGFLTNLVCCGYRIHRAAASSSYWKHGVWPWALSSLAGLLWFSAVAAYGAGALLLGAWGPVYGWVVCVGGSILVSTVWGLLLGEWAGVTVVTRRTLYAGIGVLLASLVVLGLSGFAA